MKKKLMAVAVGAALAAPAASFAAVEISGRGNVGIGQWSATGGSGGDLKSRLRVWDSGSNITIKAAEDLGGGLKVDTYIETGLNIDQGDTNAQNSGGNGATGPFGSRQAWVGLAGNFGKITFGKQNTWYGSGDQDLAQAVYLDAGVQFATGNFTNGPRVSRLPNAFRYTSPKLGPVEVQLTYAPMSDPTTLPAPTEAQGVTSDAKGNVTALTIQGSQGQFSGGIDIANNKQSTIGGAAPAKRSATKLRGGFKYQPGAQISLIYVQSKTTAQTTGTESKQNAWQLNWEHAMGNIGLHAAYGKVGELETGGATQAATGTTGVQFGVRFIHSKTTWTYINYVAYTNDTNATADFQAGGMSSAPSGALTAGADPKSLAFGISHRF